MFFLVIFGPTKTPFGDDLGDFVLAFGKQIQADLRCLVLLKGLLRMIFKVFSKVLKDFSRVLEGN